MGCLPSLQMTAFSLCPLCSPTEKNALCLSLLCHQSHHDQSPKTTKKRPYLQCHSIWRVGGPQLHYIVEAQLLLTAVAGYVTWILSQMTTLSSLLLGKVLCPSSIQCRVTVHTSGVGGIRIAQLYSLILTRSSLGAQSAQSPTQKQI